METFYTIIKIAPNTVVGDSISIGLLACQSNKYIIRFSERKKNISKNLLHANPESIDFIINKITQHINKQNSTNSNGVIEMRNTKIINPSYFDYLNSYCTGLLQFSKPSFLNDTLSAEKFEKLFSLLIDNAVEEELYEDK